MLWPLLVKLAVHEDRKPELTVEAKDRCYAHTYHGLQVLLQAHVPRLLHRHHSVAEGLFAPPQDLIRDQVEVFEGVSEEMLLHAVLLETGERYYHFRSCTVRYAQ